MAACILIRIWFTSWNLRGGFYLSISCIVAHRKQTVKLRLAVPHPGWYCTHVAALSSSLLLSYRNFMSETWNSWASHFCPALYPFGEGMKVCSLPPPQNISNFHLSSLRITCLTGAGVQAVLICPFARTLCKQSVSYLLCEEGKKNDLIALAGHVIGHPFILLTINYICNQRDSTFSTSKMLLSKAIGMLSVHHICPQSMNF